MYSIHLGLVSALLLIGCGAGGRAREVASVIALDGMMIERRASHSAVLLQDGRVLVVGGIQEDGHGNEYPTSSAELFDPQTNQFKNTANLTVARSGMATALLEDGRVLLAGGWERTTRSDAVEIYDPATERFTRIATLRRPREAATASRLSDGSVLIAGGTSARGQFVHEAERFFPKENVLLLAGHLQHPRSVHTATLLLDGSVLLIGGVGFSGLVSEVERFDPQRNEFNVVANTSSGRYKHAAIALADGRVLLAGGSDLNDWRGQFTTSLFYDSQSGFVEGPNLRGKRFKLSEAITRLKDGSVIVAGGSEWIERLDIQSETFEIVGKLDRPYYYASATALSDGRVLIAGGYDGDIRCTRKAWVYQP